jgi:aspartate-semialdehyde dehydrogenase
VTIHQNFPKIRSGPGIDALATEVESVAGRSSSLAFNGDALDFPPPRKFAKTIAFDVLPYAGAYVGDEGWTDEELKLTKECRKILDLPNLKVAGTCVRVPVYTGRSLSLNAVQIAEVLIKRS